MGPFTLPARSLRWYWRTNLAVLAGATTATAVLGGALLAGDSVRASLRELALSRLGNVSTIVTRDGFFGEALAPAAGESCPVIAIEGAATHEPSGRRAGGIEVYGIDERFWRFKGTAGDPPRGREVVLTQALERELGSKAGDTFLLRVQKPSAIPLESLHGRKEDTGKTIRLTMSGVATWEFSLRPQQGDVRAVYVPLERLQRELNQSNRVNTILVKEAPGIDRDLKERFSLADVGLKLRPVAKQGCLSLESDSALVSDELTEVASSTAKRLGVRVQPLLTYLANRMRAGGREIPYSLVTALDSAPAPAAEDGITLNEWAARDLAAKPGDLLTLEYYVWKSEGRLATESAQFRVEQIVPIAGVAADQELTPDYPGITGTKSLRDWDPPFPLDLSRIRPMDEQYWDRYRTTPKAFISLERGRRLWGTRFGSQTSIRISPPAADFGAALRASIDPAKMGLTITPVRARSLEAAQGATDFGAYFVYFSFFLMFSALLLTGLFFKLGTEQRTREIGVLRALGFCTAKIRTMFLIEGAALALAGGVIGAGAAAAYCGLILVGLRTWWFDAVGTRLISLHVSIPLLAAGAVSGIAAALASILWTLRRLEPATPRGLLSGERKRRPGRRLLMAATVGALLALTLAVSAWMGNLSQTAGFFGSGVLLLTAALLFEAAWLRSRFGTAIGGQVTLGFRSVTYRPGRSMLCIALIASATFVIVSLDAFRRDGAPAGTGGFPLLAESTAPLIHNPNTPEGREALDIAPLEGVEIHSFRLRPGDDASCLNLYRPRSPRILAPSADFLRTARFAFRGAISDTPNPWLLLESPQPGGAIPVIADANSLDYVLHLKLGEEFGLGQARFRVVAALRDSLFQSELLVSETNFLRLFPGTQGYRFFLLSAPAGQAREVTGTLESSLADYGFDVQPADARLRNFHKVENTYLSTFRALGALGLILGTIGFGAVLMRNVLERGRDLALLRAVGYGSRHLAVMVLAENALLLLAGLATGTLCALVAVAPAAWLRGGHFPLLSLGMLLGAVLATGIAASLAATAAALKRPLLAALKSE